MTSRIGRGGNGSNEHGSRRLVSSSTAPQTLADKLKQELGPERRSVMARLETSLSGAPERPLLLAGLPPNDDLPLESELEMRRRHFDLIREEERRPTASGWQAARQTYPAGWLGRQLRAGLLGLALGLIGVIPTVLWLTGRLGDHIATLRPDTLVDEGGKSGQEISTRTVATVEIPPVLLNPPKPILRPAAPVLAEKDSADAAEELLLRAQTLVNDGELLRAREILSDGILADNPKAAFVLAETFDPNILAATGVRGIRAEVERARMLYGKALAGGVAAAKKRLDALN